MSLSSPIFLFCFLPAVFILYNLVKGTKQKNILLCVVSILFYAFGQIRYVPLFLGSVVLNYVSGLLLLRENLNRKAVLTVSIVLNIAVLCVFKYLPETGVTGIALPLGISFFTFQGLSYVIDSYRDRSYVTKDFMKLLLYVSFFPRLAAGPIVKFHELEDQLGARNTGTDTAAAGIRRFIVGLSKKLLISDVLAGVADTVFAEGAADFRLAWIGAVFYALQLYYDFSGYSDMAIGIGTMFGFTFPENFDHPYGSSSIREFWRRWHISLSSWFKEYVYIPLGGNRKGKARAALNRFAVFVLTGVWHGARLTYLLWGLGHGLLSSLEDFGIIPVKKLENTAAGKVLLRVYTLVSVTVLFVLFRSDTLHDAFALLGTMFAGDLSQGTLIAQMLTPAVLTSAGAGIVLAGNLPGKVKLGESASYVVCLILLILSVLCMAKGNFVPFIYAAF